jgi:hypothetical protein
MRKSKWVHLVVLTAGTVLAAGGCAAGGWLPWLLGAGAVALLTQQSG